MSGLRNYRNRSSTPENMDEILGRYSTPVASSSPPLRTGQPYDFPPRNVEGDGTAIDLPSSPPPYYSSSHIVRHPLQHRRSSTHSGYMSRDQLFGRAPTPDPASSPVMSSTAIERIEGRRSMGRSTPEADFHSSPLTDMHRRDERALNSRSSLRSLKGMQTRGLSTPDLRSTHRDSRGSAINLRGMFAESPRDKWMEAGTPEPETAGTGVRSGFMSKVNSAPNFAINQGIDETNLKQSLTTPSRNPRKVSHAETALRGSLAKRTAHTQPPHDRKTSWASRIFNRRNPDSIIPEASEATTLQGGPTEFGYVEPRLSVESHSEILPDIDTRGAIDREDHSACSEGASMKDEMTDMGGSYVAVQGPDGSSNSFASISALSAPQDFSIHTPQENVSSKSVEPILEDPLAPNKVGGGAGVAGSQKLTLVPTMTIVDQPPVPPNLGLELTSPKPILSLVPTLPGHNFAIGPVQVTISEAPIPPSERRGLTFAGVNAIIYGCISFAMMRIVLMSLGEHIPAIDVAQDMSLAFVIGVLISIILHWV